LLVPPIDKRAAMGFIIMEAVRLMDEAQRSSQPSEDVLDLALSSVEGAADSASIELRSVSHFPAPTLAGDDAIAIVELATGRIRTSAGTFPGLERVAALVAKIYAHEASAVEKMSIGEAISEIVMTTERYWTMTRPLKTEPPSLAVLVFDPQRGNVVLERLELDAFVDALEAWSSIHQGV